LTQSIRQLMQSWLREGATCIRCAAFLSVLAVPSISGFASSAGTAPTETILIRQPLSASIADWCIALIAALALGISFWQIIAMKRHQRVSVRPLLDFVSAEEPRKIRLTNGGLGPAIITGLFVRLGEGELEPMGKSTWQDIVDELELENTDFFTVIERTILFPGASLDVLTVGRLSEEANAAIESKLQLHAEYESMYGERFSVDFGTQPFD